MAHSERVTVPKIRKMKGIEPITVLTAYDYLTAQILDRAGIEILLVGDSLGMVFQGLENTLPVTLDESIYHTRAVARGTKRALVVTDMPFLTFQVSEEETIRNAGRCLQEGGAHAVKLEGGTAIAKTVQRLYDIGIPVMGHVGLTPQSVHKFGGFELQGKNRDQALSLLEDARALDEAGAFCIVVESVPEEVAALITESVSVPTIGIGAGLKCDGQVLVTPDLLGLFTDFEAPFVKRYANLAEVAGQAVGRFASDVKQRKFPEPAQTRKLKDPSFLEEIRKLWPSKS